MVAAEKQIVTTCYHCGQVCESEVLLLDDKPFCCPGCQTVFEILNTHDLCEYYSLDKAPGSQHAVAGDDVYAYLDEKSVRKKLVTFDSAEFASVQFYIPAIHCVSCIWLLENLQRVDAGFLHSEVNFARKTVSIDFNPQTMALSRVGQWLADIGYAPSVNLERNTPMKTGVSKQAVLKLALAGFCFGNVMLFSFPEYLGLDATDAGLMRVFSWLNLTLSIPVFFYSAAGYFQASLKSFQQRQINIDVPIAAGLLALFLRSAYDIITATGPGYLDSFTGLVFFLLIGRWFQSKTYESLAFDRDFTSYFPLAVQKQVGGQWKPVVIYELTPGDTIRIRNLEIIPADSVLLDASAHIDYSFVTGEARPVLAHPGDMVYAGGRVIGPPASFVVEKPTSQSHLTSLWNNDAFRKTDERNYQKIIDRAARRFTWIVLGIAVLTACYWFYTAPSSMWLVITSVLMVACPCALALAAPFTYGSMLRVMGRHALYLKNADVIERLAAVDAVVFDKTGTITLGDRPDVSFVGNIAGEEYAWIKLLTSYSTHPLSKSIAAAIRLHTDDVVTGFKEIPGKGIEGVVACHTISIGSASFTVGSRDLMATPSGHVFVAIDGELRGHMAVQASVRKDLKGMLGRLGRRCVALLSGDTDGDRAKMYTLFGDHVQLHFNQSPHDKLDYIRRLQQQGKKVLMVGDGLNDAGALKQADVGLAVTDDTGIFTPACDGILHGSQIQSLDRFMQLSKASTRILKIAFTISFMYNAVALTFAVTGHLTPLVAAILMPLSSVSVVGFSSIAVNAAARRILKKKSV
ncbi:heavy metal translocating P-type ATPase [Dawidia soli]|uniref:Heavy metal translocating P-type ATPase metal-binding domain-containing protein n=1 Tax=Dawidia soli TaxID=2782352 RepID=A0AAP2DCX7_9BACT|nr:heavy metal translocating P-type ATPase metal-binding domain-containing protein [Dawidia soli]MBT1689072.1 heavy metal translocating P-type ATPase metal-binding domain-containing protein [Dawidia soli]